MSCDSCTIIAEDPDGCPGLADHCRAGEHCTWTGADCSAALGHDDHDRCCCHCGAPLKIGD